MIRDTNIQSILLRTIGTVASAVMAIAVLRYYGPSENGYFQIGLTICLSLSTVLRFGQDNIILKSAIFKSDVQNTSHFRQELMDSMAVCGIASIFFCSWLFVFLFTTDVGSLNYFIAYIPILVVLTPLWVVTEALRGLQHLNQWALWQGVCPPVSFICLLALDPISLKTGSYQLPLYLFLGYLLSLVCASVALKVRFLDTVPKVDLLKLRSAQKRFKERLKQGMPFWFLALLTVVAGSIDTLLLGWISDAHTVGIYQPLVKIGGLIAIFINVVCAPYVTKFALELHRSELKAFASLYAKTTALVFVMSLCFGLAMILSASIFLPMASEHLIQYRSEFNIYVITQIIQSLFIMSTLISPIIGLEKSVLKIHAFLIILKIPAMTLAYQYFDLFGFMLSLMIISAASNILIFILFVNTVSNRYNQNRQKANL